MDIIIDSNIIVPEYELEGSRTRILFRSLASMPQHTLYVPRIVVDEVCGLVFKQAMSLRRRFEDKIKEISSQTLPINISRGYSVPSKEDIRACV
jgi:hypothetical protein